MSRIILLASLLLINSTAFAQNYTINGVAEGIENGTWLYSTRLG